MIVRKNRMKIAVCDDDKGCLDSMKRLLAGYPGISRTEYYQNLSQLSEALENGRVMISC